MKDEFENFVTSVTLAHKYIQFIKKREGLVFGLKGFHALCLYYLDKYPEGTTVTELSKRCCEDKATVSRALETLSKRGYLAKIESVSANRKRCKVVLTPEGRQVAKKVDRIVDDVTKRIGAGFSDEQLTEFYSIFMTMDRRLSEYCANLDRRGRAAKSIKA